MSDNKTVWSLNPIEKIAYNGLKQAFVGTFMVKDFLDLNKKEDAE